MTMALSHARDFPGFRPRISGTVGAVLAAAPPLTTLIKQSPTEPDEFLLVLGTDAHYLMTRAEVDPCGFHEWSVSREHGQAQGTNPITARSVDPAAFFFDGELHHCAHRSVHDRRVERCQIRPFEEFLCCRACTLQRLCWNETSLAALPCGTVAFPTIEATPNDTPGKRPNRPQVDRSR